MGPTNKKSYNRSMKVIIGLGNPGSRYEQTRHNVGFMAINALAGVLAQPAILTGQQALAANLAITTGQDLFESSKKTLSQLYQQDDYLLVKPQTFMNNSGQAVRAVVDYYLQDHQLTNQQQLVELYVVHDDLDLKLGSFKLQFGKGPREHKGLLSIYQHLKTKDFWHLRFGVDNRQGERQVSGADYVLQGFSAPEQTKVHQTIQAVVRQLMTWPSK
ncbi:MAG: aminoacyl-tRNA hydrolase [Candidatus Pacebacteria bacterium]|nr:aminoacyl-tRNA hydrolase [Candidatus Paceibacterota bacterium]